MVTLFGLLFLISTIPSRRLTDPPILLPLHIDGNGIADRGYQRIAMATAWLASGTVWIA